MASSPTSPEHGLRGPEVLLSEEQRALLDHVDNLWTYGVNKFVSLPQLVVCGDQSAGKSSVLEAITEIPFPRGDQLCTQFPTQIVLRRRKESNIQTRGRIIPAEGRSREEAERLRKFSETIDDFSALPDLIRKASDEIGISLGGKGRKYARDILSLEVFGPNMPHLTMVDIPGIVHLETDKVSRADIHMPREIANDYMNDPRTIALAVITMGVHMHSQEILGFQKRLQKKAEGTPLARTLGILTKPDLAESAEMDMGVWETYARNEDSKWKLEHGWHILRNRSPKEMDCSWVERTRIEDEFFQRSQWKDLPPSKTGHPIYGVQNLRARLSQLLYHHIRGELPKVKEEINKGVRECEAELRNLGEARESIKEQVIYLSLLGERFRDRCKAAVEGLYNGDIEFFTSSKVDVVYKKRLRALVQKQNHEFADDMRTRGHSRSIFNTFVTRMRSSNNISPFAIAWVQPKIEQCRGREPPGSYNPLLIPELFCEQSHPWSEIAKKHLQRVFQSCVEFVREALRDLAPENVRRQLDSEYLINTMATFKAAAENELERLLAERKYAITYDHSYLDRFKTTIEDVDEDSDSDTAKKPQNMEATVPKFPLHGHELNNDVIACEDVLLRMQALYEASRRTFVDNVAVIVIERHLMAGLSDVLSSHTIINMTESTIARIAGETAETRARRHALTSKLETLKRGLEICQQAVSGECMATENPEHLQPSQTSLDERWGELGIKLKDTSPNESLRSIINPQPAPSPSTPTKPLNLFSPSSIAPSVSPSAEPNPKTSHVYAQPRSTKTTRMHTTPFGSSGSNPSTISHPPASFDDNGGKPPPRKSHPS